MCDGDRHVLVLDNSTCLLYETYRAVPPALNDGRRWRASAVAVFNLSSNRLRPLGWTSADAAGLPILPGLIRYDEVAAGKIDHALRFTGPSSRAAYQLPATHYAPTGADRGSPDAPWMGMRVRLRGDYACGRLPRAARVVCEALQTHGGIFADNGIPSSAFDVLDAGCLCTSASCAKDRCARAFDQSP